MSWSGPEGAQGVAGLPSKEHVDDSIARALRGESYLDPEVLKIHGFATPTMRHLFSNLCHIKGATYLEIGTFCGATFVAAFNNNWIHAIGVDDFTQSFEETGVREQLHANVDEWKSTAAMVDFINFDCWQEPLMPLHHQSIDIYYYDGNHSFENQSRALPAFFDHLSNHFLFIVDDTNWKDVSMGTAAGFAALEGKVKIEQNWRLTGEQSSSDDPTWHNGLDIYLCSKVK